MMQLIMCSCPRVKMIEYRLFWNVLVVFKTMLIRNQQVFLDIILKKINTIYRVDWNWENFVSIISNIQFTKRLRNRYRPDQVLRCCPSLSKNMKNNSIYIYRIFSYMSSFTPRGFHNSRPLPILYGWCWSSVRGIVVSLTTNSTGKFNKAFLWYSIKTGDSTNYKESNPNRPKPL